MKTFPGAKNLYTPRGGPTQFSNSAAGGKYDITGLTYPTDLMSDRYGSNYVVFYINVSVDSKILKEDKAPTVDLGPGEARDRGDTIASNITSGQVVSANAAVNTIAGLVGGSIAFKGDTVGEKIGGSLKGAAIANIPTLGIAAAAKLAGEQGRQQRRLKAAIAMHIPNQFNIKYTTQWSEEDTAMLNMAAKGVDEIVSALTPGKDSNVTGTGVTIAANLGLSKAPNAAASSAALGLAANPKKEQVFKGVDFRSFSFDYQFFPKDEQEAKNVLKIIQQFKYHMHPEFKDTNNFVYLYPSEFDIFYYQGSKENMNVHRHTSCVLTDLNVNYTPNGSFNTFDNGMPTQINVQMTFRELALLTKDKIKDGL